MTFSLPIYAAANGYKPKNSHDSADDVRTLVHMLQLAFRVMPSAVEVFLALADVEAVRNMFNEAEDILIHIGANLSAGLDTRVIVPVVGSPINRNEFLCFDVQADLEHLRSLDVDDLIKILRDNEDIIIKPAVNHMPPVLQPDDGAGGIVLAGIENMQPIGAEKLALAKQIRRDRDFQRRLVAAWSVVGPYPEETHLEKRIYGGFAPDSDRNLLLSFQAAPDPVYKRELAASLQDDRFREWAERRIYTNWPEALSQAELRARHDWYNKRVFTTKKVDWPTQHKFLCEVEAKLAGNPTPAARDILVDYKKYLEALQPR
jgi:exonuclease I